mgnify:CR=1 FL=1
MSVSTPHINLKEGTSFAKTVLMPGDPLRSKFIAENFLENAELINSIGEKLAKEHGVNWLYADFKKENGYKRSIELSKEYELYRQRYCGCLYSKYAHIKTEEEA